MTDFIIKKVPGDHTSDASWALAGQYTKFLGISALVDRKFPVAVGDIPDGDILKSCLGLLVQGKTTLIPLRSSGTLLSSGVT